MKMFLLSLSMLTAIAASSQNNAGRKFPMAVQFASHCCGVPSDSAVVNFVKCFKKKFKLESISAHKLGPAGREGEYYLAFPLEELNNKQRELFVKEIACVKIAPGDKGGINFEKDFTVNEPRFMKAINSKESIIKM
jgi:hypothetical protein